MKIFFWLVIFVLIFGLLGGWLFFDEIKPLLGLKEETLCTQDAKLCPDGSYVGRVGPNCEFAACPSGGTPQGNFPVPSGSSPVPTATPAPSVTASAAPTPAIVSGLVTYSNLKYSYQLMHTPDWKSFEAGNVTYFGPYENISDFEGTDSPAVYLSHFQTANDIRTHITRNLPEIKYSADCKNITFAGLSAVSCSPQAEDAGYWVFVKKSGVIFEIMDPFADENSDSLLSSFKFTK